jgi:beta-mannosidase
VFCRGACWTPLDVVTLGATPDAYDAAIAQVRACGMNMIRVGGTMVYEDDAFLDALDREGVLLWQDLMFANMDYPDELPIGTELDQQLARLQARPSLAIVCGNSEGQQQAAMAGATRDRWAPKLFHDTAGAKVAAMGVAYVPSSTHGGAFPHQPRVGVSSYYGVGAYLRPIDDARRSEVRFASECLGFANIGEVEPMVRVHHAAWKRRAPRDLGAGWDFDDVRDHYVRQLYGIDPATLRYADHDRYLALGRATTGEVMAQTFAEWRRARSMCRGGLVWFLRDLWPGAGWGVVEANGIAKPCWYALRRALAPVALAITDEGTNGLAIHAFNDRATPVTGRLDLVLYRSGEIEVGRGSVDVAIAPHESIELDAASLFDGWLDLSFAYRFGPPVAHVVHAILVTGDGSTDAFWFPAGMPSVRELDIGLAATVEALPDNRFAVIVTTRRFAQSISFDVPGFEPDDMGFHLAPGGSKRVVLRPLITKPLRGTAIALNAEATARILP